MISLIRTRDADEQKHKIPQLLAKDILAMFRDPAATSKMNERMRTRANLFGQRSISQSLEGSVIVRESSSLLYDFAHHELEAFPDKQEILNSHDRLLWIFLEKNTTLERPTSLEIILV